MPIRDLFTKDRDPTRPLNEVVNAEDDIDVRSEVDEYVFTDHTLAHLRELVEGLLDTGQGTQPDCLRTWISGFFGSGKSHFLKLAATLLSNIPLKLDDGSAPALQYAVQKHGLSLPWERIAREFHIRAVIVNLATAVGGGRQAQDKPLLFRLMSELCRGGGDSSLPHIAELEREIKKAKKWDVFLGAVRDECERIGDVDDTGRPLEWTAADIRNKATDAHSILERVLSKVLPKFADATAVRNYLKDAEAQSPSAESVVQLALRVAEELHPELGRILLCVDEVALYLTGNPDRVREVQGLAETVKSKGRGKVLLWVTAQQRVDTIDQHFAALDSRVGFLRDRFPARFPLEERDIDTVVRERWLKKDSPSPHFAPLQRLVTDHGGLLARAAKLHDESLLRDSESLTNEDAVLAYYPCLPYHVRLLQAILTAFRGEKQVDQTAAQSRALLTAIRMLFVRQNGADLAEVEIGALVTFDRVYDVIREVVRKADSVTDQLVTQTIEQSLGSCGVIKVSSVAKVILLLQHLNPPGHRRIKIDAENIAALLYPQLGTPWEAHLKDVREACAKLLNEHFIGEEPESGYRLYRQEERTFQQEVDSQPVDEAKLYGLLRGTIEKQAASLGMKSVAVNAWHKLPVNIAVHVGTVALPDPNMKPSSLELHMVWPKVTAQPQQTRIWAAQYMGATHLVIWYLTGNSDAEDLARKTLKLEAAIKEYSNRYGQQTLNFLRGEQAKLVALREESIPQAMENAITSGVVIYRGVDKDLADQSKKPQDIFKETMKQAVNQVFTQIDIGSAQVDEAGLKKVFSWRPPQSQPTFFSTLKLFDADGHPLVDRPFLKEIMLVLQGRPENERVGTAIIDHFAAPLYGWPERAVKAGIAALLRGRRLTVKLADGTIIRAPTDPKAENWLVGTQMFGKAVLELSDLTITPTEREILTQVFADVFEAPGAGTVEKLEKNAKEVLSDYLARVREAHADLHGRQMPGATMLKTFVIILEAATEPELPVGMLKQLLAKAMEVGSASDTVVATLKPLAELLRTVERLRTQGKLDSLAEVRTRATMLYRVWEAGSDGGVAVSDIEELHLQATTEKLIIEADRALQRDSSCFALYAADYCSRHEDQHKHAQTALTELKSHTDWDKVSQAVQEQLRNSIAALDCESSANLVLPASTCRDCETTFGNLSTNIELIEHRLQQALRRLDEVLAPPPQPKPKPAQTITMDLRSLEDLPCLYEQITEMAQSELTQPRRVRVIFEDLSGQ